MSENELPKLPKGWSWYSSYTGNTNAPTWTAYLKLSSEIVSKKISLVVAVEVSVEKNILIVNCADSCNPEPIPLSVLSAVLKANGVEL